MKKGTKAILAGAMALTMGASLAAAVNDKIKALYADGTVAALAAKYGIAGQLVQA